VAAAAMADVGNAQLARDSVPILKDLYNEHEETAAMLASQVAEFQEERRIAVKGSSLRPVLAFHQLGLKKKLLRAVRDFKSPSPIQAQGWPIVLSGHDLIGIAATGSGALVPDTWPALLRLQHGPFPSYAQAARCNDRSLWCLSLPAIE
jgi:hypothetical protein